MTPHHLELQAPAKINLFLEILGKRPDGYHELETVMLRTDFCDRLTFDRLDTPEIIFSCITKILQKLQEKFGSEYSRAY